MRHYSRGQEKPIPNDLTPYLSKMQQLGLCQAEQYGWHLAFVRRKPFANISAVIGNADDTETGVLRDDGTVDIHPDIHLRH